MKLKNLRIEKKEKQKLPDVRKMDFLKKKVVYNNSSRKFTEEQLEVLALGLNFGITPKKFPLVEYIQAAELLCQRLQEVGDADSVEKATSIRNVVFQHLKQGYKMKIKANLTRRQREIIKELKEDNSIIICPADKGKAVVIEDKDVYLMKTHDQIIEGDYTLTTKF